VSGSPMPTEIECPLCSGIGTLSRAEILDRLGVKDFARVAQLSAEEAFRLLQQKHKQDEQNVWARFETLLTKRTAEIEQRHRDELHALRAAEQEKANQIDHANRRVEDSLREVAELRERNHELETEMAKVARVGKKEEMDFADEARTWAGMSVSEKLGRNGDFILAYRDASGAALEPRMLIDCKDKTAICEGDITKLVRDSKERSMSIAILVARDESQLRQIDKECRWGRQDGVWVLRTCRQWLPRDLDVLKPLFERMRLQGSDFLDKNAALADEVRRTFADLDRIEGELKKASKAITSASGSVTKYRTRLQELCDTSTDQKKTPLHQPTSALAQAGD
jgi:predicted nuclease with TOPRIM domain